MIDLRIHIVTFNENEAAAVDVLFDDISDPSGMPPSSWTRTGNVLTRKSGADTEEIRHRPLGAQGNVTSGMALVEAFVDAKTFPDYVVFYGCAGTTLPSKVGHAFLIESTSYVSLGTVAGVAVSAAQTLSGVTSIASPRERVTVKNKWLCKTVPPDGQPLAEISFASILRGNLDLRTSASLDVAHVAATDKVVKSSIGPTPVWNPARPPNTYDKGEWAYGEALAFVEQRCSPLPLLIEMESYGIGRAMSALRLEDRVVILRVVTDALADKDKPGRTQFDYLKRGLTALGLLLMAMIKTARGIP